MNWVQRLLAAMLIAVPAWGQAQDLAPPAGPVILTVTGAITRTNRGPFDDFDDGIFRHHERRFARAAAFDLAMLQALGIHEVTITFGKWPRPFRFEGPWLKDVLAAVGADGKSLTVLALDGFASEISAAELAAQDWIVAMKRDDRYLDIGGRGPLWLVYAPRDGGTVGEEDEQRWPWAAFLIEVQ